MLSSQEWSAVQLSLQAALCAVAVSLPFAIGVGYLLARWRHPAKWLVQVAVDLPLVLPPIVTGVLLLVLFAPNGFFGKILLSLGIRVALTWWGAAIAAAVVSFPLLVRAIRLAFQSVDPRLEFAARSLGAGRLDAFATVSLPLAMRGVVAGSILAFARGLGEFGATIMVAGNIEGQTQTIPLAIYSLVSGPDGLSRCWKLAALAVALSATALALGEWLERKQIERERA